MYINAAKSLNWMFKQITKQHPPSEPIYLLCIVGYTSGKIYKTIPTITISGGLNCIDDIVSLLLLHGIIIINNNNNINKHFLHVDKQSETNSRKYHNKQFSKLTLI